jgi:hypothetical protein
MYGMMTANALLGDTINLPVPNADFQCGIEAPNCLTTPLPGTIWLFATGLAGLAALRRKR